MCFSQQLLDGREWRKPAVRPAPFIGHFGRVLVPAHACLADNVLIGHEYIGERDFVEVMLAIQERNGAELKAVGVVQVD